jgi:hypothetical protein
MKFVLSMFMTPTRHILPLAIAAERRVRDGHPVEHVVNVEQLTIPYPYTADGKRRWPEFTSSPISS